MPFIDVYISNEDYDFLWNLANENSIPHTEFAKQLLASKLTDLRDEIQYIEELQQELDVAAEFMEKSVEEVLS
jgi:hypothetical protein